MCPPCGLRCGCWLAARPPHKRSSSALWWICRSAGFIDQENAAQGRHANHVGPRVAHAGVSAGGRMTTDRVTLVLEFERSSHAAGPIETLEQVVALLASHVNQQALLSVTMEVV